MLNFWLPETARESWASTGEMQVRAAEEFRLLLLSIDERLDLRFIKQNATNLPAEWRGHWVVLRHNGGGVPPTVLLVQDEKGLPCAPDERHLRALQERDAERHPDVWRKVRMDSQERQRRSQLALEEKSAEFQESLLDRLDHLFDVRIAVTPRMKEKVAPKEAVGADAN